MKEITAVMTVEITVQRKMDDKRAEAWEKEKAARMGKYMEEVQRKLRLNKVELKSSKVTVRDVKPEQ